MNIWKIVAIILVGLVFGLWLVRLILPSQVDDVNPLMNCTDAVLNMGDVYFAVPEFDRVVISENKSWCNYILSKHKEVEMHGVYHTYLEFAVARNESYFDEGVGIFSSCFGFEPEGFKPPNLGWTRDNDWIRKRMKVYLLWDQVIHKVYHCGDTGMFPNWLIRIF